jgi:hypothetical protein
MKLVRVRQLGRAGYLFKDPAYFEHLGQPINDGQPGLELKIVSRRDYQALADDVSYGARPENRVLSAPSEHIEEPSEVVQLALQALVALSGGHLVITTEPVSLA